MRVRMPYGSGSIETDIPDNWINGRSYRATPFDPAGDERAELLAAFEEPVGIASFEAGVQGRSNCVVVLDPDYPDLFGEFLADFLEELEAASGLSARNIMLLFANSPWNPRTAAWIEQHLPKSIRAEYPVELHDPFDPAKTVDVGGIFGDKIKLRLNKTYVNSDLRVLLSPIVPDVLHGFRGGRSLILPGLAHQSSIGQLYSFDNINQPSVGYGQIRDNPLHIASTQALHAVGCDVTVAPLMTPDGRLSRVVVGDASQAFLAAASRARERLGVSVPEQMDIVVTSGGGAPYDTNLFGALNSLAAAETVLKKRGTIILAAELSGGFGPRPLKELLMACDGIETFARKFGTGTRFIPGQWIAQRYLRIANQHEIIIYSKGLSQDDIWQIGATPAESVPEAVEVAMQGHGQRCKICALPDGPTSLAFIGDTLSHFA